MLGNENVFQVGGVATGLGIEVCTAIAKASVTDDLHHCLGQFEVVNGELVCIPAVLVVTTVGVDGASIPLSTATASSCSKVWPPK